MPFYMETKVERYQFPPQPPWLDQSFWEIKYHHPICIPPPLKKKKKIITWKQDVREPWRTHSGKDFGDHLVQTLCLADEKSETQRSQLTPEIQVLQQNSCQIRTRIWTSALIQGSRNKIRKEKTRCKLTEDKLMCSVHKNCIIATHKCPSLPSSKAWEWWCDLGL